MKDLFRMRLLLFAIGGSRRAKSKDKKHSKDKQQEHCQDCPQVGGEKIPVFEVLKLDPGLHFHLILRQRTGKYFLPFPELQS